MANTTDSTVEQESMISTFETNMGTLTINFSLFDSDNWTKPTQTFDKIVENVDLSTLTDINVLGKIVEAYTPEGYEIMEGKGSTGPSYWLINENTAVAYVYEKQLKFTDVTSSDWFYYSVKYVYDNRLMTGLNETTFGPYENLARAQFVVILHRMNGSPDMEYTNKFPDVADNQWYTDAILWANEAGVVGGYTDTGKFGSGDNINREQMAVMMYRYANYLGYDTSTRADISKYTDAGNVNEFAKEAMSWAVGTGIITGKENETKLDPQGNASRAECATIIMRFVENYK